MSTSLVSVIVAFLSVVVSLVAIAASQIGALKIARRQIESPMRQKWISDLRDLMSTLLSTCRAALIMNEGVGLLDKKRPNEVLFKEILFLEQKLELMLNPNEKDHQELVALVDRITDAVQHGAVNIIEFGQNIKDASTSCKAILKCEWERIRRGEGWD